MKGKGGILLLLVVALIFAGACERVKLPPDHVIEGEEAKPLDQDMVDVAMLDEWYDGDHGIEAFLLESLEGDKEGKALNILATIYYRNYKFNDMRRLLVHYSPDAWYNYGAALLAYGFEDPEGMEEVYVQNRDKIPKDQVAMVLENAYFTKLDTDEEVRALVEGGLDTPKERQSVARLSYNNEDYDLARDIAKVDAYGINHAFDYLEGQEASHLDQVYFLFEEDHPYYVIPLQKDDYFQVVLLDGLNGNVVETLDYEGFDELYLQEIYGRVNEIALTKGNYVSVGGYADLDSELFRIKNGHLARLAGTEDIDPDFRAVLLPGYMASYSSEYFAVTGTRPLWHDPEYYDELGYYWGGDPFGVPVNVVSYFTYDPHGRQFSCHIMGVCYKEDGSSDVVAFYDDVGMSLVEGEWKFNFKNPDTLIYDYTPGQNREEAKNIDLSYIKKVKKLNGEGLMGHYGTADDAYYFEGGLHYGYDGFADFAFYENRMTGIFPGEDQLIAGVAQPMTAEEIKAVFPEEDVEGPVYSDHSESDLILVRWGDELVYFHNYGDGFYPYIYLDKAYEFDLTD